MLRHYHDTLVTTLSRLQAFLKEYKELFAIDESFDDQCGCVERIFEREIIHLTRWRVRLFQRMLRFDAMRDGVSHHPSHISPKVRLGLTLDSSFSIHQRYEKAVSRRSKGTTSAF